MLHEGLNIGGRESSHCDRACNSEGSWGAQETVLPARIHAREVSPTVLHLHFAERAPRGELPKVPRSSPVPTLVVPVLPNRIKVLLTLTKVCHVMSYKR